MGKGTNHDLLLGHALKHPAVECLAVSGAPAAPGVAMCCGDCCVVCSSRLRSTKCQNARSAFGKNAQYLVGLLRLFRVAPVRLVASADIRMLLYYKDVGYHCWGVDGARV